MINKKHDPREEANSLEVVRAITKLSCSLINIDNIQDENHAQFCRKLKQDILVFNEWMCDYTGQMMINLTTAKGELIINIQNALLKFEEEVYVEDAFTHEMVFYLAKVQSALNNLKKIDYPWAYTEYVKPIISRAENLLSKNHITKLEIMDQVGYKRFVEHFDVLGKDLIPKREYAYVPG